MKKINVYQFVDDKLFKDLQREFKTMQRMMDSYWEGRRYESRSYDEYQAYLKRLYRAHPKITENVMRFLSLPIRKGQCFMEENDAYTHYHNIRIHSQNITLKGEVKRCFRKVRGYYPPSLIQFVSKIEANGYEFELMPSVDKNGAKSYLAYCHTPHTKYGFGIGSTATQAVLRAIADGRDKRQQTYNHFLVKKRAYIRYREEQNWL